MKYTSFFKNLKLGMSPGAWAKFVRYEGEKDARSFRIHGRQTEMHPLFKKHWTFRVTSVLADQKYTVVAWDVWDYASQESMCGCLMFQEYHIPTG